MSPGTAQLFVRVRDNMGAVAIFYIAPKVTVTIDLNVLSNTVNNILQNNCGDGVVYALQTGNIQQTVQYTVAIAATLNAMSNSLDSNDTNSSQQQPLLDDRVAVKETLVNIATSLPLSDISSVKLVTSALSCLTNTIGENTLSSAVIKLLI